MTIVQFDKITLAFPSESNDHKTYFVFQSNKCKKPSIKKPEVKAAAMRLYNEYVGRKGLFFDASTEAEIPEVLESSDDDTNKEENTNHVECVEL